MIFFFYLSTLHFVMPMPILLKKEDYFLKPYVVLGLPLILFFFLVFSALQDLRLINDSTAWQAHFLKGLLVMSLVESTCFKVLLGQHETYKIRILALVLAFLSGLSFEIVQELVPLTGNLIIDMFLGKSRFEWQDVIADWMGSLVLGGSSVLIIKPKQEILNGSSNEKVFKELIRINS